MGERPYPMKENVIEYLREQTARKVVDEQLASEEAALKDADEAKKKSESENMKFDVDAAERDNAAADKEAKDVENQSETKDENENKK